MVPKTHWNLPKYITTFNHTQPMRHSHFFITLLLTDRGFSYTELIPCVVGATEQASHSGQMLWEPDHPHLPHKHTLSICWTAVDNVLENHSAACNKGSLTVPYFNGKGNLLEASMSTVLHFRTHFCLCRIDIKPPPPCSESLMCLCTGIIVMQSRKKRESSPENCCSNCHSTWDLANAKCSFWSKPRPLTVQKTWNVESLLCEL